MTESELEALLPTLITMTCLLCCCCTVLIGGGLGAFFYFRRKNSGGGAPAAAAPAAFTPPVMGGVPSMGGVEAAPAEPVEAAPTPFGGEAASAVPSPFSAPAASELPGPATPIDPDDIRAKLLGLNGPDQPYAVQATGYKIVIAPTAITGYLLEVAFDFVERVARFVETNPALADPRLKHDARQVLEANGWTVRE